MTRAADQMSLRQAKRVVKRMIAAETGKAPRAPDLTRPGKPPPVSEFSEQLRDASEQLRDAYRRHMLCLACLRATDYFYLIAGSGEFYMRQLSRLGVPAAEALLLAGINKDKGTLGGMRRTPVCLSCATGAGMEKLPVSDTEINLRAAEGLGGEQPVPVALLAESEEIIQGILAELSAKDKKRDQARRKQEEYEMRLKGAQKDVADFFEKLEKGKIAGIEALGYLGDITNGHIKVFFGEPGRAVASDGRFVTTVSQTPRNPERTVSNARGKIAKWERENLRTEPEPAAEDEDDDMTREYRMWSDQKKASLVTRYDYADDQGQRDLLEKNRIRPRDIERFREQVAEHGWKLSPVQVPLPDELSREQMCNTCGKDKALIRENFAQEKIQGKYSWAKKCNDCKAAGTIRTDPGEFTLLPGVPAEIELIPDVPPPAAAAVQPPEAEPPLASSEASRMIALMGRKRDISARLAVIGEEKARKVKDLEEQMARLTRELDEEKKRLSTERDQVENDLLELVSG